MIQGLPIKLLSYLDLASSSKGKLPEKLLFWLKTAPSYKYYARLLHSSNKTNSWNLSIEKEGLAHHH